jgi:hypothetical protein
MKACALLLEDSSMLENLMLASICVNTERKRGSGEAGKRREKDLLLVMLIPFSASCRLILKRVLKFFMTRF